MSELQLLVDGIDFGEGPRWRDGRLWYSDFFQHEIRAVDLSGDQEVMVGAVVLGDRRPSGLGWLPDGRLIFVSMVEQELMQLDDDGSISQYADLSGVATGKCNDMVVDGAGRAYVGNFGFDLDSGADPAPAALALVQPDRSVSIAAEGMRFPNGSVITPDGSTLIVGQTFASDFVAFDIGHEGTLSGRRQWAEVPGTAPDGCSLDAEGAIWFADAIGSACVRVAEGGEVLERVDIGQPTFACMLGGPDGTTLFVVSADFANENEAPGTATGAIRTTTVDVPHAGRP